MIRFGMPSWWLLAAFLPAALVFLITMIAAPASGAVTFHPEHVARLLLLAVLLSLWVASRRSVRRLAGGDSFGR